MAEADYGPASFALTVHGNMSLLVCPSANLIGHFHLYKKTKAKRLSTGEVAIYFECKRCCELGGGQKSRVTVREQRVTSNPDASHNELCAPIDESGLEAMKLRRETIQDARNGKKPIQAYREGLAKIPRRFQVQEMQERVENEMPSYKTFRPSLYRATAKKILPIHDVHNLPMAYQLTIRGREAYQFNQEDAILNQRFLLRSDRGCLIFASSLDLEILHQSEFWIADGTFEMCPSQFAQIYTIHAFFNGEAVPCCHALLPNKTRATYEFLFHVLLDSIVNQFGGLGNLHTVICDFEAAAHGAIRNELNVSTRGCLFHFGQCLIRNIQKEGLKVEYEREDSIVREWVRLLKALSLLPSDLVLLVWQRWLQNPPNVDGFDDNLQRFKVYFQETWLNGRWTIDVWNHFSNNWLHYQGYRQQPGPRTSNHAEGWHNRINHDFGKPHPALNTFLHWLQETHYVNQVRIRQLQNGEAPRRRNPEYVQVDERIARAKRLFVEQQRQIPMDAGFDRLLQVVEHYLRLIRHLLG